MTAAAPRSERVVILAGGLATRLGPLARSGVTVAVAAQATHMQVAGVVTDHGSPNIGSTLTCICVGDSADATGTSG